jgi:hypothetical protein
MNEYYISHTRTVQSTLGDTIRLPSDGTFAEFTIHM